MAMAHKGLAKLVEELGELSQVCGKKLAYMDTDSHPDKGDPLSERLEAEIADVLAAIFFTIDKLHLNRESIDKRIQYKLMRFEDFDENGAESEMKGGA